MKPTVGRIIHYVGYDPPKGTHLAAIVTEVFDDGTIGLHMFPIPSWAEQVRLQDEFAIGKIVRGAKQDLDHIGYNEDFLPGTWHWPEREE